MDRVQKQIVDQIPHLRRYARALLRDRESADDLVQDCLTRAMERLHLWRPGSDMRTWLFSILHNLYVNDLRRKTRRPDGMTLGPEHDADAAQPPKQAEGLEVQDIADAIGALDDNQRETLLLIALEGLSYAETAAVMDVPVGTVMSRINRGRRRLREILEESGAATLRRVK